MSAGTPRSYFEQMYDHAADPWGLGYRWYERRKYACSLAALPKPRYRNGFEPGCSIGVLSGALADRCERLLCVDHMLAAVEQARRRLEDRRQVRVEQLDVPHDWPDDRFDLVMISELAYYLDEPTRVLLWKRVADSLDADGTVLVVHWRPLVADHPASGDAVHAELATHPAFERMAAYVDPDFRLEVHRRVPVDAVSVASADGLR